MFRIPIYFLDKILFIAMALYPLCATMQSYVLSMAFKSYSNVTGILFSILFAPMVMAYILQP